MARRRRSRQENPPPEFDPPRIPDPPRMEGGAFAAVFGGALLALMGMLPLLAITPWWNWLEARDWNMANATITQTRENLVYEYEWAGKRYAQTTFSIEDGEEHGGISPVQYAFLQTHKPGDTVTAYVNPEDPGESVLDRSMMASRDAKFYLLVSAGCSLFVLPGLLSVFFGLKKLIVYVRDVGRYKREAYS